MAEALHLVDLGTCKGDGICVDICPENVLEILDGKAATVESREGTCTLCGQCVAVCPTEALQIPQLPANDFGELAKYANEAYSRDGTDRYMYRAPMVMLFHGSRWAMSYEENAHLVCHHAMLAAVSLGLGSTIIGMIPPIVDRSNDLRQSYGIPKENKVMTSLILGHPKYKYQKSIRRDLAGVQMM